MTHELRAELTSRLLGFVVSQALSVAATLRIPDLLAAGPRPLADREWQGHETVVDVGGGDGALLQGLLERHAGIRGIVFDLPEVVAVARERIAAAGLAGRCRTVPGSFFQRVPGGGDVYVLHNWADGNALEILRTVRRAMPDHGRVLVVEEVVAPLGGVDTGSMKP